MNINASAKRLDHGGFFCHMRDKPQFDLRIVSRDQFMAICRDKGGSDLSAFGGSDWNILHIRVR